MNKKFLNIIYDNWEKHYTEGYSNEGTGNLNIQTDESFRDIYSFLNECVLEYLNILKIDNENFDINFVKSWFNSLEKASTPRHFHGDAHISVVYYAQTPLDAEQFIQFESNNESKEPFPGAAKNNAMEINEFNAYYYSIKPKAGSVLVFPSNLFHQTFGENKSLDNIEPAVKTIEDLKRKRICIASDVVLTYKEKSNKSLGLQPVSLWRRF